MAEGILHTILSAKREEVALRKVQRPLVQTRLTSPMGLYFENALAAPGISLIAEIKRASPSRGALRPDLDPVALAHIYRRAGAAAISVLTDEPFFEGCLDDLRLAVKAGGLPVLRKDFIIDCYQILEAADAGAAAVLLIVAALDQPQLIGLIDYAHELGLAALVEVHDAPELERAQASDARVIGINNRNLTSFKTDLQTSFDLLPLIDEDRLTVAESGIHDAGEVQSLERAGVNAVLVGEALVTAIDPAAKIEELLSSE
ncbi:MAG: indole-3-glycerol phosphate synthase TrpC [Candidatus Alcyoniella australis]|nr:indole-3-glycerol phosphate synthase TrpC [Candidatus Alcyoniella australis]